MKKWVALLVLMMSLPSAVYATAQISETLILDGQSRMLFTNPLDPWLRERGHANQLKAYISPQRCTASWRGYAGTWEIRDDQLVLIKLKANPCSQSPRDIPLDVLFPGEPQPVVATWFSGSLTVPDGNRTRYVHMGYLSRYERYILLQIKQGKVVGRQTVKELPDRPVIPPASPDDAGSSAPRITP